MELIWNCYDSVCFYTEVVMNSCAEVFMFLDGFMQHF